MVIDEGLMEKKSLERVKLAMLEKLKLIGKQKVEKRVVGFLISRSNTDDLLDGALNLCFQRVAFWWEIGYDHAVHGKIK